MKVLAHRAYFQDPNGWSNFYALPASAVSPDLYDWYDRKEQSEGNEQLFIKITNESEREVEVTHVWLETNPPHHVVEEIHRLPKRLQPDETYEVWVAVDAISRQVELEELGRVRISTGKVFRSRLNDTVPKEGFVARPPGDFVSGD